MSNEKKNTVYSLGFTPLVKRYIRAQMADGEPAEPRTVSEARASLEKKWEKAMECEMESLRLNNVWDLGVWQNYHTV